ncbi:gluconate 2-dehydrogenase gamma chain [Arthrobacter pigmenti]|uniref:Gluconate 2-dehydrogenase gamma chain n=1 Tax=Arthrobacter pigmenti TaxID=271432 RepID=A0A846RT87_9MICC|nr:gluconate 2-dehydrogenase subunit 3 family protein [Arthrobacter pigmenti]NJC21511.1 gluconate 2-dehydrogenase gamma chain [Arthrobacter pigmenti]
MTLKSDWEIAGEPVDPDSTERLFFTQHEWDTVEAATARIMPTDHDPGAREARVVVFIDRYVSGIDYVFAAADGSGFLKMSGRAADAWRGRQFRMQALYRRGVTELDALAREVGGKSFVDLTDDQQDEVFIRMSGAPKPAKVTHGTKEPVTTFLQGSFDEDLPFFETLCLHTRQGFYSDPVYGGNKDQMGWKVIGFPGPKSLKDTMDGTYDTTEYFHQDDYDWYDLIPHLRVSMPRAE